MKFKDRIKSYGFWTALSGAVVILAQSIAKCFGLEIEEELISNIIMSICGVLVVFGVVTMPNKKTGSDESEEKTESEENLESEEKIEEKTIEEKENIETKK